jgi:ABC-type lipopolysaccharide export system ATPase subunit
MILKIANIGYIIENGHIVGHGEAASLLSNERVKQAYLGET